MRIDTFLTKPTAPVYPLIERYITDDIARFQVIYAAGIHGILLRHPANETWNGYTLLTREQAESIDPYRFKLNATYLAPAGRYVSWMLRGANGKLTQPIQLNDDEDFWLGTVLEEQASLAVPEFNRPLAKLASFVNRTQQILGTI